MSYTGPSMLWKVGPAMGGGGHTDMSPPVTSSPVPALARQELTDHLFRAYFCLGPGVLAVPGQKSQSESLQPPGS